jgi:hypothetical protein
MDSKTLIFVEFGGILWYAIRVSFWIKVEVMSMARPKKNGTYLNVCIETPIYERLVSLCEDAGQTKTVAVERALLAYLDDYDEKQRILRESSLRNNQEREG